MAEHDHYMKFYPADYLADTGHLSTEEHGAYLLLIIAAFKRAGRLPMNQDRLRRLAGGVAEERWPAVWASISEFFDIDGDELVLRANAGLFRDPSIYGNRPSNRHEYGPEWKSRRHEALKRDDYLCRRCSTDDDLVVHHVRPLATYLGDHEAANVLENLLTLCRPCHGVVHAEMKAAA
jgi:uncharacterized protein YdaU (DUF1376 family)